jgi:YegS/Rv2252/BmrU family lipid kinase
MEKWFLLINPFAGGGQTEKKKQKVFEQLRKNKIDFDVAESYSRKEAIKLIHEKLETGFRKIIALGGDGTLNSLVNGIFSQQQVSPSEITIALIPVGTGNDWIKTHHIPKSISKAIEIIGQGKTSLHDIGILKKKNSEDETRYFINVAGCAFQGFVAERIEGVGNWLKVGPSAFYLGVVDALFRYKATQVKIELNNATHHGKFFNVSIGICKSAGGGMRLTPDAISDDGLFDITIAGDLLKREVVQNIPRLFNGNFVHHHKISQFRTKKISVSSFPLAPIETDGEVFGYGDFEVEILEKAVQVITNH